VSASLKGNFDSFTFYARCYHTLLYPWTDAIHTQVVVIFAIELMRYLLSINLL